MFFIYALNFEEVRCNCYTALFVFSIYYYWVITITAWNSLFFFLYELELCNCTDLIVIHLMYLKVNLAQGKQVLDWELVGS